MVTKAKTKAVAKRTISRSERVRAKVLDLRKQIENDYLALAEQLSHVQGNEYYLDYGFKSFSDYCQIELGVKTRRAVYLVGVWNMAKNHKLSLAKIKSIGWTKAKELIDHITAENADELLKLANENTVRDLHDELQRMKSGGKVEPGKKSLTTMKFYMDEAEVDVVSSALEAAKTMIETENPVTALEHICTMWLQEYEDADPPAVDSLVNYVKRVFGVTLVEKTATKKKTPAKKTPSKKKAAAEKEPESPVEKLTTKKALRDYIKKVDLSVKIARGETVEDIRKKIKDAEATADEAESVADDADMNDIIANGDDKEAKAPIDDDDEVEEEDINKILGIN